jgi:hypothetical protein
MDIRPGEFVMRTLFAEFTVQAEKKMEAVMAEPLVNNLHRFSHEMITLNRNGNSANYNLIRP